MTAQPFRLPVDHENIGAGRLIDRSKTIVFQFDGKAYCGFAGDTLASALLANGVRVMGRSFKFHRPRSCFTAGPEEPNALVAVGSGGGMTPNERATMVELHDGLVARSQNRWPSLAFDVGHLSGLASRLLPAGFQHKTFKWPAALWPFYERAIRRTAGLGPAPQSEDHDTYEHIDVTCDVLVAGGGVAGIAAARAAMEAGARVIICEQTPRFGGVSDLFDATIDDAPTLEWIAKNTAILASSDRVHVLTRTSVAGLYDHNFAILNERLGDHRADESDPDKLPRERLWKVRAKELVVATGAVERSVVFANNDRTGVMVGTAIRAYASRYAVAPGAKGIIFTNNDDGYRTARELHDFGIEVVRVVDIRREPQGALVDEVRQRDIEISAGHALASVDTTISGSEIRTVQIAELEGSDFIGGVERVACDFVSVSGGWNPQAHLTAQCGGKLKWDASIQSLRPGTMGARVRAAGAANGTFTLRECLREGYAAGERAAFSARGEETRRRRAPLAEKVAQTREGTMETLWSIPAFGALAEGTRHFVDQASDVTTADIGLAVREGYQGVEHLKRYTALGMGGDQGKTGNVNALAIHAQSADIAIEDLGTTTFRPPYLPVTFGAIAGMHAKDLYRPVRRTPIWHWHRNNGAVFEPVHLWRRPFCYGAGEINREKAIEREVRAVRTGVGILDASTLGKIEVQGPDAAQFLDRIYCRTMSTLEPGRCRYGLMLDEQGFVLEDGVVARLGSDHYLLHTTSSGAEHISAWLERWAQTEWPDLRLFITPVTEQWAQFVVAGPLARDVMEAVGSNINFAGGSFPYFSVREGTLAGVAARVYRISYSGELSYEIAVPANLASAVWDALLSAGEPHDIIAFGTEAMHVLRAEKGYIAIGEETDGTVTPMDLGLDWMVSKGGENFVGKFGLERTDLVRPDRLQLVGLESNGHNRQLPHGGYLIASADRELPPPHHVMGHVTSTCMSPILERPISLALIERGRERHGETVICPSGRERIEARIVEPTFYDKDGERQNV